MAQVVCSLLADGPSDTALLPILRWIVAQRDGNATVRCEWADLRELRPAPRSLSERILKAVEFYSCDVLFVHRDAEKQSSATRYAEIAQAIDIAKTSGFDVPHICVVPVRMQEAWLLFSEQAIRTAAGNPNGTVRLFLPHLSKVEDIPDPKTVLYALLCAASELQRRRLKKFNPGRRARQVPEHIADFSPLRALPAFQRLEADVAQMNSGL